jgi:hypothetical protein
MKTTIRGSLVYTIRDIATSLGRDPGRDLAGQDPGQEVQLYGRDVHSLVIFSNKRIKYCHVCLLGALIEGYLEGGFCNFSKIFKYFLKFVSNA